MSTEQSQYSKLPKKHLLYIAEKLVDEDFPVGNPYDSYDFDDAYNTLQSIGNYFNIQTVQEDVEFWSKFLEINDSLLAKLFDDKSNKQLIEEFIIPIAKTYDLYYTVNGSCTYEEFLAQKFDCYDKDWVMGSARQQRDDGAWDIYDGRMVQETEYDNFETNDYDFESVDEVNDEGKTNYLGESMLNRLVIENTQEVVDSLDKKTLMKLRSIIESRLRLL